MGGEVSMPELPEVETIRRDLKKYCMSKKIRKIEIGVSQIIGKRSSAGEIRRVVEGRTIRKVGRRGKFLLFFLDSKAVLVVHLGMTGQLLFAPPRADIEIDKHTHAVVHFADGSSLLFRDIRKFGRIFVAGSSQLETELNLGPEPLSPDFKEKDLAAILRRPTKIKQLLLDQRRIAGIGNIYADEILFEAGINPLRAANTLQEKEVHRLFLALQRLLKEAIDFRGTSVSDYVDTLGRKGEMQTRHKVYRKTGEACIRCGADIIRIKAGGRSTHFCPQCQGNEDS
jgi:formamidopyrimidine-DNA glycosylase